MSLRRIMGVFVVASGLAAAATASSDTRRAPEDPGPAAPSPSTAGSSRWSWIHANDDVRLDVYVILEGDSASRLVPNQAALADPRTTDRVRARMRELRRQHELIRDAIAPFGVTPVAEFSRLANALHVKATRGALARIRAVPGVRAIGAVPRYERATTTAVPLVGAPAIWETSGTGATGKGIRVGVIDTGIDYTHADLGGSGDSQAFKSNDPDVIEPGTFPTTRVVGGWDFVGDAYDGKTDPVPDADPIDCTDAGHGTHVSGILAGNGVLHDGTAYAGPYLASLAPTTFKIGPGMAPEASLYSLKVFGCTGSSFVTASALEWAADPNGDNDFSDRLDVVNLSLGSPYGVSEIDGAIATELAKLGTSIVAAAGNSGNNFFVLGTPAAFPETIAVAATNDPPLTVTVDVIAPSSIAGKMPCVETLFGTPLVSGDVTGTLVMAEPPQPCEALTNAADVAGRIVLVDSGICTSAEKAVKAEAAGAIAMIVNYDVEELWAIPGTLKSNIPSVLIYKKDADILRAKLAEGVTLKLAAEKYPGNPIKDYLASFTSRGPSSQGILLKPDVAAPGMSVDSAAVGTGTAAVPLSGTSMACPMAAGAATLLRSFDPAFSDPVLLKSVLMNSALPILDANGHEAPWSLGGAGRISLDKAARNVVAAAAADPPGSVSISFGSVVVSSPWSGSRDVVLSNHSDTQRAVTALVVVTNEQAGVTHELSSPKVTVPAHGTASLKLTMNVDPSALNEPSRDTCTPATQSDEVRHFVVEPAGYLRFDVDGMPEATARLPFHAVVRAASAHKAGTPERCLATATSPVTIPIDGASAHPSPLTSAFELITKKDSDASIVPYRNIVALGAASNLASAKSFEDATLFFGIAVAGDWATPAMDDEGGTVGVLIDVDKDGAPDFGVAAEPYDANGSFRDVLTATLYDLVANQVLARRYLNVWPRSLADTQPFVNSVIVLPVSLSALGLKATAASMNISAYAIEARVKVDSTQPQAWDPTKVLIDTAREGASLGPSTKTRVPFFTATDPVKVAVDWKNQGETALPSVLLLHHANEPGQHMELIDLAATKFAVSSDLTVKAAAASPAASGNVLITTTVANSSQGAARHVSLTWTANGGDVVAATASSGTCSGTACALGDVPAGGQVKVDWQVKPGAAGIHAVVAAASADDCELNPADNTVTVDVGAVQPDAGQTPLAPANEDSGSCGCRVPGSSAASPVAAFMALLSALLLARRKARRVTRISATVAGVAVVIAACSSDDKPGSQVAAQGGTGGDASVEVAAGGAGGAGVGGDDAAAEAAEASADAVEEPLPTLVGGRCETDADCLGGLMCIRAAGTDSVAYGVPKGLCTLGCGTDPTICDAFGPSSTCGYLANRGSYCLEKCAFGPKGSKEVNPAKCHGRLELACSPSWKKLTTTCKVDTDCGESQMCSTDGLCWKVTPVCQPMCATNADCGPGLFCSVSSGICYTANVESDPGDPIGSVCDPQATYPDQKCYSSCLYYSTTYLCSDTCTKGAEFGCRWDGTGPAQAACLAYSTSLDKFGGWAVGDIGRCVQLCDCPSDCLGPGFFCNPIGISYEAKYGRKGMCWPTAKSAIQCEAGTSDSGADGQAAQDAAGDASGTED